CFRFRGQVERPNSAKHAINTDPPVRRLYHRLWTSIELGWQLEG
ncbi:unnamed protein product, partial [Didymodactylos carnosus]